MGAKFETLIFGLVGFGLGYYVAKHYLSTGKVG